MKKYRFRSAGNVTVYLTGSRKEAIVNKLGEVIGSKIVPAKKIVFDGGYGETDDPDEVELLKQTAHWNNDIYWDPTCVPEEEKEGGTQKAKELANVQMERALRKKRGREAAIEGSIPREE